MNDSKYFKIIECSIIMGLGDDFKGSATLDLVASRLRLDDNAALRRVRRARASVDQEARSAAHVVGGRGVELVAVVHALEGHHVTESVGALGKRSDRDLALARRVVSAGARLARAAASGVDVSSVVSSAVEVVAALGVGVRTASGQVERGQDLVALSHRGGGLGVLKVEVSSGDGEDNEKN